jgi:hypothetical protein
MLRCYVAAPPLAVVAVTVFAALHTDWRLSDAVKFLLLVCCGAISVASTPRMMYRMGGVTRDFSTIWLLPVAVLLPPVYALLMPIPLIAVMQLFVHRGVLHRAIFTAASISLSYALAWAQACMPLLG